jgi:hypothetical protein
MPDSDIDHSTGNGTASNPAEAGRPKAKHGERTELRPGLPEPTTVTGWYQMPPASACVARAGRSRQRIRRCNRMVKALL